MTLDNALKQCMLGLSECLPSGEIEALFRFPHDFSGFQGHFPNDPVLPGVVQMMAVVLTLGRGAAENIRLTGVKRCKFTRPVRPLETMRVRVHTENGIAKASLTAEGEPCAVFSLYFEGAGV